MGEVNIKSYSEYKKQFARKFRQIESEIGYENKHSYTDFKKDIECWLIPIFDLVYDAEFIQEDSIIAPAIDIKDTKNNIAIQITGNKKYKTKIKDTIVKFYNNKLQNKYNKLYIFFLESSLPNFKINIDELRHELEIHDLSSQWNQNIFDPKTHIIAFGNIISILCTSKFYDKLDSLLFELDKITGKVEAQAEADLKNLSKGISINEILNKDKPDESVSKINLIFLPYTRLPDYIFLNLYLFGSKIGYVVKNGVLETSNIELFNHVDLIIRKKERSSVVEFLLRNNVVLIIWHSKVLNLLKYGHLGNSKCNMCKFRIFETLDLSPLLDDITDQNLNNYFEKLYFFIQFGKFQVSIDYFQKLLQYTEGRDDLKIARFHLLYNLEKFKKYFLPTDEKLPTYLDSFLKVESMSLDLATSKETNQLIGHYLHFHHIENQYNSLKLFEDANYVIEKDQKGWNVKSKLNTVVEDIYHYVFDIYEDNNHNLILYDLEYANVSFVLKKSFKLLLQLSSLVGPQNKVKNQVINERYLEIILNYLGKPDLDKLLFTYRKKSIFLKQKNSLESIHQVHIKFLSNILTYQKNGIAILDKSYQTYSGVNRRIETVVQNITSFYSIVNFSNEQTQEVCEQLIKLVKKKGVLSESRFGLINIVFNNNYDKLVKIHKKKIEIIANKFPHYFADSVFLSKNQNLDLDEELDLESLLLAYHNNPTKYNEAEVFSLVTQKISENFSFYEFRLAVLFNINVFDTFVKKAIYHISKILDEEKRDGPYPWNGYEDKMIQFIELLYSSRKNTRDTIYEVIIQEDNKYIKWLMDLENITEFEPYWLLKYQSEIYYDEFKKHSYIKKTIEEYLKTHDLPLLSHVYFKYFV